ncbi:MarR family winged helix-turn-helix transcriptional regulator [Streptomyces sp. NPDC051561]|uniref:MarR family winged helix-turn-helix transcriptional regulator n=1 Tax=Streptomyces sp. NPDC051561 TaxID=3365658 RepID=UPI003797A868
MATKTPALTPSTANPRAADADLASQPVAYWAGLTGTTVKNLLRDEMARLDVTQPQWWVLNRVDAAPTRAEVVDALAAVADSPHDTSRVIDQLLHRGWLALDDSRLSLTEAGREGRARVKELVTGLRVRVHDGVSDEEYVAALKVMRRMIRNVEAVGAARGQ